MPCLLKSAVATDPGNSVAIVVMIMIIMMIVNAMSDIRDAFYEMDIWYACRLRSARAPASQFCKRCREWGGHASTYCAGFVARAVL